MTVCRDVRLVGWHAHCRYVVWLRKMHMRLLHMQMWRDNQLLMQLFEPEELEALVCGGTDLDFNALQRAANYEDGFDEKSEVGPLHVYHLCLFALPPLLGKLCLVKNVLLKLVCRPDFHSEPVMAVTGGSVGQRTTCMHEGHEGS